LSFVPVFDFSVRHHPITCKTTRLLFPEKYFTIEEVRISTTGPARKQNPFPEGFEAFADGGLVGASAHIMANHLAPRNRPGGVNRSDFLPRKQGDFPPGCMANWGSLHFPMDQDL
jgi:hypothetical protein